jgi:hypothetical protein
MHFGCKLPNSICQEGRGATLDKHVSSFPSYLPLHACTPKGCLLWLTTQQPKRKEEEKKEEKEKEAAPE